MGTASPWPSWVGARACSHGSGCWVIEEWVLPGGFIRQHADSSHPGDAGFQGTQLLVSSPSQAEDATETWEHLPLVASPPSTLWPCDPPPTYAGGQEKALPRLPSEWDASQAAILQLPGCQPPRQRTKVFKRYFAQLTRGHTNRGVCGLSALLN